MRNAPNAEGWNAPYTYRFGPFRFESELEIPELRETNGAAIHTVRITLGPVPQAIEGAVQAGAYTFFTTTEYLLNIPGTARYYARDGSLVTVEVEADAAIADITTYLLGSIFGALCYQNGLLPLHASAVEFAGGVAAFLGDSGAGKSTLAACLNRRGHDIVSDDICLLDPSDAAVPRVIPVTGWLKLWNRSLEHLGEVAQPEHRVHSAEDKYRVYLRGTDVAPRPLRYLVFLERTDEAGAKPALTPLSLTEAVAALMDMAYALYIPVMTQQQARLFRECAGVFRHGRAYRLTRPWSLERTDEVLDVLERGLAENVGVTSTSAHAAG